MISRKGPHTDKAPSAAEYGYQMLPPYPMLPLADDLRTIILLNLTSLSGYGARVDLILDAEIALT